MHYVKMKFSIKDFFGNDQIHSFLRIWSQLLKKSLMENFIFCAVMVLHSFYGKEVYVMRCAIWYHLYKLKNLKNTHGGVLLLVKLHVFSL